MKFKKLFGASIVLLLVASQIQVSARDWYVSAARGKGKSGKKSKPAKDLGNIVSKLKPGDVVHIAAGTYPGRGKSGADIIKVPVSIIGGYSDDFSSRDPWGKYKTIFSGDNKTKNYKVSPRVSIDLSKYRTKIITPILIDGLIVDQGAQNHYKTVKQLKIVRLASPKTGANPTPDRGGIFVRVSRSPDFKTPWNITVKNNLVLNSAPTQGALAVFGYAKSRILIENNLVINCTGTGIYAGTSWAGRNEALAPKFTIKNNSILFIWKYDAFVSSFSGVGFKTDSEVVADFANNIIAFSDRFNIQKQGKWPLNLKNNILIGAVDSTYYETVGDSKIQFDDLEDEAEYLSDDSGDNKNSKITIPISKEWLTLYGSRVLIDRNAVEADIKPQKTRANMLRSILGLNQRADDIKADSPIWLPRISVDDALKAVASPLANDCGASSSLIK
ncbi:MAG: hypothetical protein GXP32_03125 [Kiritimatiellaeota bacterium]|nr:hypothetical protein [Kiritimatiellota bacterium]